MDITLNLILLALLGIGWLIVKFIRSRCSTDVDWPEHRSADSTKEDFYERTLHNEDTNDTIKVTKEILKKKFPEE